MTINKKIDLGPAIERDDAANLFLETLADVGMPLFRCQYDDDMYPVRKRTHGGDADPKNGATGWGDLRVLIENGDTDGIRANNEHELSMGRVWAAATEGRLAVIDVDGDSYVETDDDGNPVAVREEEGKKYYTPEGAWNSKVAFVEAELDRRGITVYAKVLSPNKRGGAHFYVEGHPEIRNKTGINVTNPLWTKVDVRGYGGMIYLPGSRRKKPGHNGGTYEVEFNHLADLVDDTGAPKARAALLALYNEMYQPARTARTLPELSKIDLNKVADKYSKPRQLRGEFRGESRANRQLRDDWILADLANLAATPKGGRHDALLRTAYGLSHWCKKTGLDPRWIVETLVIICKNDWKSRTLNSDLATIQDGLDYGYDSPRPWPSTRKAAAKGEKPAKPAGAVITKAAIEEAMRAEAIRNGQAPEPTAQDDAGDETAPELDYTDPAVLAELSPDQMDWDKVPGGRAEWFGLAEEDSQAVADHWYNHRGQDWMHTSDDRWFKWDDEHGVWEVASDVAMWEDVKAHVNLWVQLARLARLDGLPDHEYVAAFRTDSRRHRQVLDWVTRDSRLNVPLDHLDRNPYLFAFYDGQTWDSKTCTGRPSRREDRLTRYLSFPMPDVAMRHPDTDMVLRLWGPQDSELHRYAQARWAEMVRPRYIPDQRILVVHGPKGDDGKSMFRDVLTRSCRKPDKTNPYVGNLPLELFTHGKDSVQRLNAMSGVMHTPLLLTEELSKRIKFEDASIKDAMTRGEQSAMAKYKERVNYDPLWAPGLFVNDFPTLVGHLGPALWKRWIVFPTQARYIDTDDPSTLGPGEFPMDDELSARIEADPIPVYQALWAWLMRGHIILKEHNGSMLRSHFPWPAEVASATAAWRAQYDNALGQFYSLWLDFDDPNDEIKQRRPSRSTHADVMKAIVKWTGDETGKGARGEEFAWSAERVKERMLNDPDLAARGAAWAKGRVPSTDKDAPKSPIWCWKGFTVREHPSVLNANEIEFEEEDDENEKSLAEVMGVEDEPF